MAVLKLDPTKAPNLTGTSQILARAGLTMDRGFEAAQGLLGSYQEGQSEKADNEVAAEINQLNSREEIEAYFAKDGIAGRPISSTMRERLAGLRSDQATLNQTRAGTAETLAGTIRADSVEARRAAASADIIGKRDQARANAAGDAASYLEGRRFGEAGSPGVARDAPGVASTAPGDRIAAAAAPAVSPGAAVAAAPAAAPGPAGDTERGFMGAVSTQVTNPYALAAIAATGKHESAFTAENAAGTWADGKNRAGGVMSWNGDRLAAMQAFTKGDASPEAQAAFFLQEDPALMKALEGATSVEEAVTLMNNAWRFKGYDQPGGEAAARLETAKGIFGAGAAGAITQTDLAAVDPLAASEGTDPLAALRRAAGGPGSEMNTPRRGFDTDPGRAPGVTTLEELQAEADARGITSSNPASAALTAAVAPPPASVEESVVAPAAVEIASNPTVARDARIEAIMANPYLTGQEMITAIQRVEAGTSAGEAAKIEQNTKDRQEMLAQVALQWSEDPDSSAKPEDLAAIFRDLPGTAAEKVAAGLYALSLLGEGGALADVNRPNYIKDPTVARGVAQAEADMTRQMEADPTFRILRQAQIFGDADPVDGVWEHLELANDKHRPDTYLWGLGGEDGQDRNLVRQMIKDIADDVPGVNQAEAAAALVDMFKDRDPWWGNSNDNLFNPEEVKEYLRTTLSDTARLTHQGNLEKMALKTDDLRRGAISLDFLRIQRKKMNDTNTTPAERSAADAEIKRQQMFLRQGSTWYEGETALSKYLGNGPEGTGMADMLQNLDPNGPAHKQAVKFIILRIQDDSTKTEAQKRLLIATIRS